MRTFLRTPLAIALLLGLALRFFGLSDAIGHVYWNLGYKVNHQSAPASLVLVSLDDTAELTTGEQARLLEIVRQQVPRKVYFDARIPYGISKSGDAKLAQSVAGFGKDIAFVARAGKVDTYGATDFKFPPRDIIGQAPIVVSAWNANFLYYVESGPYALELNGRTFPSFSASLAGVNDGPESVFYPDFSVDPVSIVRIPVKALLKGEFAPGLLTGRTVVISSSSQVPLLGYFGHATVAPLAHDIAGAVALQKPVSLNITFVPLLALIALLIIVAGRKRDRRSKLLIYSVAIATTFGLPLLARTVGIVISPDVSIVMLAIYGSIRLWQKRTRQIQHTSVSGLPNLLALSASSLPVGRDVVVAVIGRYEEILATLPQELHGECAKQIARRIAVGSGEAEIYHGDSGHFAWIEEARPLEMQLSHLEGLRALFSAPLQIGTHTFDTNIHFGLDRNEGLDALTRVNSALASANEALSNGRAIELFEAHRLAEAPWELSLHARIDEGLRNGDIWLAFQAQWDFETQTICGAEALIRWNHPTRGPIAPDAFILQAERAGRIDALTYWVLEEAITAALAVNLMGERFQMSVNLSAQMVDKADLVTNFAEIVQRRGIDASLLTVEVTETSSVRNRPAACHNLTQLRNLGFRLSIDDFGTGEASLAYLADLPSDELKLDRRFVSKIVESERDRVIVTSTIGLAHALGQSVVAEGIEDAATFSLLRELGCDLAQGYYLGRPQPFAVFMRDYEERLSRRIGRG